MTTTMNSRLRQPSFIKYAIGLVCLVILCLSASGYAQKVVDIPPTDADIEAQLDSYLGDDSMSSAETTTFLKNVVEQLTPATPLMSVVRAKAYYASQLFYNEESKRAYSLLDVLKQQVNASGLVDAQAEVLATRMDLLNIEGKRGDAFLLVPELERLLKQTLTPRVRFYGYNLLSSIYVDWRRYEDALKHLLAAQTALNQMDSALNQGRRLYLLTSMAGIQNSLEQWSAAIETVNSAVSEAQQAGHDVLAYDLWFAKYYAQASLGDYENALDSLRNAYLLAKKLELDFQKVIILNNFGDAFMKLGQFEEAEKHLLEAREKAKALEFNEMLSTIDFNLGFIAVKQGDSLGIKQMEQATDEFREDENLSSFELEQLLGELANAYETLGNYRMQAQVLQERLTLRQQISEQSQQQQMAELQAVYKSRDNAQQIALLEQQNALKEQIIANTRQQQVVWTLFGIAAAISLILLLLLYRKSRQANQRLNTANVKLSDQSLRDPLTGLLNRRALQDAMLKRDVNDQYHEGLLLLDIDHFKRINDKYGHATGDAVLTEISRRLQNVCRDSDMLVRWGGEEFLFYVRQVELSSLKRLASRILEAIAKDPIKMGEELIHVTTTIGFSQLPFAGVSEDQVDWERALQIADMALYTGKTQGRNRACGVTALHVDYQQARKALEHDLSEAVEQNWVELTTIKGPNA
ncbi:diguanylate cyclase (GGDEF)-like protein [Idiomarina aquatica]|uniref:diguanylate cyclase n=1 Tax=Idiomarina aquatica TaxID=1327752 RepID=A0A4R6NYE1_9GAMM|nr:diguanylate cyclase [Idiomarina aquatica]TDP27871.1 diguanylate cyclase (GGDEF)-like protein [Idiomarina aquatica]